MYEIAIILLGIICAIFVVLHKEKKSLIPLYFFSLILGILLLSIDFYFDAVTYNAVFFIPFTKYPISIICIAGMYIFTILVLQNLLISKIASNWVLKYLLSVLVIAILNFAYTLVDFIIVRTNLCVFRDVNVNLFYQSFDFNYLPTYYYWSAYTYFLLGILITAFSFLVYRNLNQILHILHIKISHKKN